MTRIRAMVTTGALLGALLSCSQYEPGTAAGKEADRWHELGRDNGAVTSLDTQSIQRRGARALTWTRTEYQGGGSSYCLTEYRCPDRLFRDRQTVTAGEELIENGHGPWEHVRPESIEEKVYQVACKEKQHGG